MPYNTDLLIQVRNLLAMYPERHMQAHFTSDLVYDDGVFPGKMPVAGENCKTTGCVAGWTLGLLGMTLGDAYRGSTPSVIAGNALGLSTDEADTLFYRTLDEEDPEAAALAMLDELIEKGKSQGE